MTIEDYKPLEALDLLYKVTRKVATDADSHAQLFIAYEIVKKALQPKEIECYCCRNPLTVCGEDIKGN